MKILVTGANGFLASRIIDFYKDKHNIIGLNREQMDFTIYDQVKKAFDYYRPDIAIHCGAISDVGACTKDPELSYMVNVLGTKNMATACSIYNTKLIFCSSDQVYFESPIQEPHMEAEALTPPHTYGRHKLEAEELALNINESTLCLRLSWMYDKEIKEGEHGSLLPTLMEAVKEKTPLRYITHDYRSITNVWEVVENIQKLFCLDRGIYNFGSENDLCTYELVEKVFSLLGGDLGLLEKNDTTFKDNPRNLRMNTSKIKEKDIHFLSSLDGFKKCLLDK